MSAAGGGGASGPGAVAGGSAHGHAHGSITNVVDEWPSWTQIAEVLTFRGGYNTNLVLVSTILLGVAAGIVGVFALLRKRSLVSDALSHATLPGLAAAFLIATWLGAEGRTLPVLLLGAAVSGVLGILSIQWLLRYTRLREDAAIGLVLSVFFGVGTVLLSMIQTMSTGNAAGLNTFIYGQTAAMNSGDAWLMAGIALIAVVAAVLLLKEFALVCFNDAYARVTGWPVSLIDVMMMALTVVVTVAGLQAVGIILVVALLIIPAVAARFWGERLWQLVLVAAVVGGLSGYLGSATSALLPRKPAGAVIVLICGVIFLISMLFAPRRGVVATLLRRLAVSRTIAIDHVLEAAYLADDPGLGTDTLDLISERRGWGPLFRRFVSWQLVRRGFGGVAAGHFRPSEAGRDRGRQVARNHRLWEQYLVAYADIAPGLIDWTVDQVEHVLDPHVIAELESLLDDRGIDSHALVAARGDG